MPETAVLGPVGSGLLQRPAEGLGLGFQVPVPVLGQRVRLDHLRADFTGDQLGTPG